MPESRGGGTSGGERWPSSTWVRRGHTLSWRMEGAEEEEDPSGNNPDNPDVDLKEQRGHQRETTQAQ